MAEISEAPYGTATAPTTTITVAMPTAGSGCQSTDGLGDVSVPGAGRRLPQPALIPLLARSGPDCPENRLPMFLQRKDCTRQRRPVPKSAPRATLMRVSRPGVGDHFRSSRPSVKNHVNREGAPGVRNGHKIGGLGEKRTMAAQQTLQTQAEPILIYCTDARRIA